VVSDAATASAEAGGGLRDPLASLSPSSAIMPSSSVAITGSESSSKNEDGVGEGGGVSGQPEVGARSGSFRVHLNWRFSGTDLDKGYALRNGEAHSSASIFFA
jgi:hypothetical protein